jgi:hypothetical protein
MQVPRPAEQHAVMIEAVENHMPEVIVIDEIGTELESFAARTIAERGVQLIGTAHGTQLENLLANPTLSDLIGGIQAVTLGDEEARRRGTQKTVLERKAPPTFDVLVEIHAWQALAVYTDVAAAVDALLADQQPSPEQRTADPAGHVQITAALRQAPSPLADYEEPPAHRRSRGARSQRDRAGKRRDRSPSAAPQPDGSTQPLAVALPRDRKQRIFGFGLSSSDISAVIERLGLPAEVVHDLDSATVVLALKRYDNVRAPWRQQTAARGVPVLVLQNNTVSQIQKHLATAFTAATNAADADSAPLGTREYGA